jgi:hypothetical protein
MDIEIANALKEQDAPDSFHETLLDKVKSLVKMSRSKMSEFYGDWDLQERVYRGETAADLDDRKQELKGKPVKMVVPNTFAQVMTFASFLFLMYNQNRTFFELQPSGDEDFGRKQSDSEKLLDRDLRHNEWNTRLFQHLLDVARFGTGILESSWTEKKARVKVQSEPTKLILPDGSESEIAGGMEWKEFMKFEGNSVRNISPYRFFPDTRHAMVDFQKGEFCAVEEEYSLHALRDLEASGEVAAVDMIEKFGKNFATDRGGSTYGVLGTDDKLRNDFSQDKSSSLVMVTKVQIWLVPNKFEVGPDEKKLGEEDFPVLYHIWYANDNRVIRCEPCGWWHNEFSWTVAQFTPDMHRTLTMGLADLIYRLQDVISWYVNSHITSVRRVIGNRLLVDPKVVDTKTLDGEGDIYLRKGMSVPLDRALKQLDVRDVTAGHMADADILGRLMETVTGVNGNAMGQYNSGRRSAQEARVVTAGAAGRMKMHGQLIWESSLGRLGRLMHSNLRQSLSFESFSRAVGTGTAVPATGMTPEQDVMMRFANFKGTPEEVVCGDDFFVFDSTLASEKGFIAQSLQELLVSIMGNPQIATMMDISPKAMLEEIQFLRGAGNVSRFSASARQAAGLEAPPQPVMMQPPQAMPAA